MWPRSSKPSTSSTTPFSKPAPAATPPLRALVRGRRPLGPASKQSCRATLRAALNAAIKQRLIDVNVAALLDLPAGRRPKALVWTDERVEAWRAEYIRLLKLERAKPYGRRPLEIYIATPRPSPVMVWTPEQTGHFLDASHDHELYALFHLIALRGLRRGEACGLRWSDLDLTRGILTVRWQITQLGWTTDVGKPKSDAGERHVALDADTTRVLRAHRSRQRHARLAAGPAWTDHGFVFTQADGEPYHPATVTREFERLAWLADLPAIRLHDLRHGAATLILSAGHDLKVVQGRPWACPRSPSPPTPTPPCCRTWPARPPRTPPRSSPATPGDSHHHPLNDLPEPRFPPMSNPRATTKIHTSGHHE